jgi:hypothetical protein
MVKTAVVLGSSMLPILAVVGLLLLSDWRERRHATRIARQIRLTDAIAGELGAIVAPVVTRRLGGPWRIEIAVPLGRTALVARILGIAHQALQRMAPEPYELVLTPQESVPPAELPARPVGLVRRAA